MKSYANQEIVAQERLDMDDMTIFSVQHHHILNETFESAHSALGDNSISSLRDFSVHQAATTASDRISQCLSILLEISQTLCENSFLGLLQSNRQIAFTSTK